MLNREKSSFQSEKNIHFIVEDILKKKREYEKDDRYPNARVIELQYGQKRLLLYVEETDASHSYITNQNESGNKEKDETTVLYYAVKRLLESFAQEKNSDIEYKILTENEKMRKWAESKGNDIFHWTNSDVIEGDDTKNLYVFHAIIPVLVE